MEENINVSNPVIKAYCKKSLVYKVAMILFSTIPISILISLPAGLLIIMVCFQTQVNALDKGIRGHISLDG